MIPTPSTEMNPTPAEMLKFTPDNKSAQIYISATSYNIAIDS